MTRAVVLAVAAAVLAAAVPAASDGDVRERNRAWLLAGLGPGFDLQDAYAGQVGAQAMTLSGAALLDLALDQLGDVDMAALTAAEAGYTMLDVGVANVVMFAVTCGPNTAIGPQPLFVPIDAQLWITSGGIGLGEVTGSGWVTSWTTKSVTEVAGTLHYAGVSDFFCFDGWIFFSTITGAWWM